MLGLNPQPLDCEATNLTNRQQLMLFTCDIICNLDLLISIDSFSDFLSNQKLQNANLDFFAILYFASGYENRSKKVRNSSMSYSF